MDYINLISTFGFPIFACVCLGYYVNIITKQNREDIKDMQKNYNTEMQKMSEALNNNTMAIHDLTLMIQGLKDDKND